jgi:hypothetical protein
MESEPSSIVLGEPREASLQTRVYKQLPVSPNWRGGTKFLTLPHQCELPHTPCEIRPKAGPRVTPS